MAFFNAETPGRSTILQGWPQTHEELEQQKPESSGGRGTNSKLGDGADGSEWIWEKSEKGCEYDQIHCSKCSKN